MRVNNKDIFELDFFCLYRDVGKIMILSVICEIEDNKLKEGVCR